MILVAPSATGTTQEFEYLLPLPVTLMKLHLAKTDVPLYTADIFIHLDTAALPAAVCLEYNVMIFLTCTQQMK